MNKDDLENLNEATLLIGNTLKDIHADLKKLDVSNYANSGRLNLFYYNQHKLLEDIAVLKEAVATGNVDAVLMYSELANIKKETETLQVGVSEMLIKYYSKYS
ncbi:MAG: hypothetical protein JNM51_14775 [Bacteroidia bacterium]|jgi:hypothetical protein|nr:hypothetical protein [Bacteroidia bacterium]